jgi:diaminopimelate epimerase
MDNGLVRGSVFYKMTGSGNDFVMLDGRHTRPADWSAERVVAICDRRNGVGADGLVVLTPEGGDRVRMDFWNCDGSRAAMCGNAALCSTRLSALLRLAPAAGMTLVTQAGAFPARCRPTPDMAELNLPDFTVPEPVGVQAGPGESDLALATVGVPHLIIRVGDIEAVDVAGRGRELRFDPRVGPAGANVNFVAPASGNPGAWALRTYERGVEGETLACGTGAVAAAVNLVRSGMAEMPVTIQTRGGRSLSITATLSGSLAKEVWLSGEGRLVFTGVL